MSAACLSHHEDAVIRDGHFGTQDSAETITEKSWAFPTAFARVPEPVWAGAEMRVNRFEIHSVEKG